MQQLIVVIGLLLAIVSLEHVRCLRKHKMQIIRFSRPHLVSEDKKQNLQFSTSFRKINIVNLTKLHLLPEENQREERDIPKLEFIASNDKPSISVLSSEEIKQLTKKESVATSPTKILSTQSRKNKDSTTFGSLSQNDLRRKGDSAILRGINKKISGKEDLNGIKPSTPFIFSTVPFVMSIAGWQITTYLAGHFATELLDSDLYPLQRAAIIARNLIVGMSTLATGFCGVISLGLVLLGIAVTVGVAKGELDPNKPRV